MYSNNLIIKISNLSNNANVLNLRYSNNNWTGVPVCSPIFNAWKNSARTWKERREKSNKLYFGINEACKLQLIITSARKKIVMEENKKRYEELYNTQMKNQIFDIITTICILHSLFWQLVWQLF